MKSGVCGLSYTKQQQVLNAIKISRGNDRICEFYEKGENMLTTKQTTDVNILLKEKCELIRNLKHNREEVLNIEELQDSGKYPELEKELNEKLCIGDEAIYNQKERLKELSGSRIAAIFDVSQATVASLEGQMRRRI